MPEIVGIVGWLLLPVAFWVGQWTRRDPGAVGGDLPQSTAQGGSRYLVILRTDAGARARQMFELGKVGDKERLELWDGSHCRGAKGPGEG